MHHSVTDMGRYHFYDKSPNEYSFMDEDLGLTTDESNFVSCCFGCEHSYGKMENIHMHGCVYGHNVVLSFHPSLGELQYCFQ
jgi:hypothetical protein